MKQYDKKKDFCVIVACEESQGIASAIVDQYDIFFTDTYGFTKEYNFKTYDNKFDQSNQWLYEKTIQGTK